MKFIKLLILLIAVIMMSSIAVQAKEISILFIGGSQSSWAGGQQELVAALLRSQGWTVKIAKSYGSGMNLASHWYNNLGQMDIWRNDHLENKLNRLTELKELNELNEEEYELARKDIQAQREKFLKRKGVLDVALAKQAHWDFVILQVSSKEPNDPKYHQTHEVAPLLLKKIRAHSPATKIILYVPWRAVGNGDEIPQYAAFRKQMVEQYSLYTSIPMLEAMYYAQETRPKLTIRSDDKVHPSYDGGYLIACLLYIAITGESPVGLPATLKVAETYDFKGTEFTVEKANAKFLQEIAWQFYQKHGLP
jgi:transposase-like protein